MWAILLWGLLILFGFFNKIQLTVLPPQHSHSESPVLPTSSSQKSGQGGVSGIIAHIAFLSKAAAREKNLCCSHILLQAVAVSAWKCWWRNSPCRAISSSSNGVRWWCENLFPLSHKWLSSLAVCWNCTINQSILLWIDTHNFYGWYLSSECLMKCIHPSCC